MEKNKYLRAFEQFGIVFKGNNENNYFADCPFSNKENKFFVNADNGLWDSKTAGISGNIIVFIRYYYKNIIKSTETIDLNTLAIKKNIPLWLIKDVIAFNPVTNKHLIPYKNLLGEVTNIGHYDLLSNKIMKTSTLKQQCLGMEGLAHAETNIVFICEGEWDYFIMKWLLKRNNIQHTVIGLPSAGIFKDEWVPLFKDKEIYCLLDNDMAGRNGTDRLKNMLHEISFSMKFINWPVSLPEKYDIRDFISDVCGSVSSFKTKHKKCYGALLLLLHKRTPNEILGFSEKPVGDTLPENVSIPSAFEIENVFKRWFKIRNDDISLDIMIGTCLANKIDGDPVWMYLVGAPGSRKTAMLMSLNKSSYVETVSTLTPAALVSGMRASGVDDPSLIPKLNNRMLVVKDVTTLLSSPSFVRDEIFGMLRDAFDGYIEKVFGNGLKKSFRSKFGVIGAVTPVIDGYQSAQSILGERFLKLRIEPEMKIESEFEIISKTLDNIDHEIKMNEEMQDIMYRALTKNPPKTRIEFKSIELKHKVINTGMFVAKLRGSINSNIYTKEQQSLPIQEVGTRVTKQLTKLAMGIAVFRDHNIISEYEVSRIQQVALDTCPDRVQSVIKFIHNKSPETVFTQEIIEHTMLSPATISTLLNSLVSLRIIKRVVGAERVKSSYTLTENIIKLIVNSGIYDKLNFFPGDVSINSDVSNMYPTDTPAPLDTSSIYRNGVLKTHKKLRLNFSILPGTSLKKPLKIGFKK